MADGGAACVDPKSDPDLQIITVVLRPFLVKHFGVPTKEFLSHLLSLSSLDEAVLECDTVDKLLDHLDRANKKGTYKGFLTALRKIEGTPKVIADFIEGNEEAFEKLEGREELKHILQAFAPRFCEIPPMDILPYLKTDIQMEERQRVIQRRNNEGDICGSMELFLILMKKGLPCIKEFITSLEENNHGELAKELSECLPCDEGGASCENSCKSGDPCSMDTGSVVEERVEYSDCGQTDDNTSGMMSSVVNSLDSLNVAGDVDGKSPSSVGVNIEASQEEEHDTSASDSPPAMINGVEEEAEQRAGAEADEGGHDSDDFVSSPDIATIELRNYQKELIAAALEEGKNSVIVAPTGSGKTVIAARLAKAVLDREPWVGSRTGNTSPPSRVGEGSNKVIFVVNKVPLVKQQSDLLKQYIDRSRIMPISGDVGHVGSLEDVLEYKDVLVMTAQLLVNALQGSREDNDRMDLSKIGLLILDECHHCQKGDPYNDIMAEYLAMKCSSPEKERPQVLGLTASMGVGKAKQRYKAQTHILALLANLDAEAVCTVQDPANLKELQEKRDKPKEVIIPVRGRKEDVFKTVIRGIMGKIEDFIAETPGGEVIRKENSRLKCPPNPGTQVYEQWLVKLHDHLAAHKDEEQEKMKLVICVDNLQFFNNSLYINRDARTQDALEYLERKLRGHLELDPPPSYWVGQIRALFDEKREELERVSRDPANMNPLLRCLAKTLIEVLSGREQFRGILFCRTRAATEALLAWMQDTEKLKFLKPGLLTGCGGTGMTQNQQTELLSRFRDGNHQLIIATSVAEEGLDIQQCNVVIRYNYISNDIGRVQAQGRNRAKEGKFYLIASEELKLHEKEVMNKIREKMMIDVTQKIQNMKKADFLKQIAKLQKEARLERKLKLNSHSLKHKKELMKVRLLCRLCRKEACTADDIRCIQNAHHVVLSETFQTGCVLIEVERRTICPDLELCKRIICGNTARSCTQEWGKQMLYKGILVSCISPEHFVMVMPRSQRIFKKWKDVPFKVQDISIEELDKVENMSLSNEELDDEEEEDTE